MQKFIPLLAALLLLTACSTSNETQNPKTPQTLTPSATQQEHNEPLKPSFLMGNMEVEKVELSFQGRALGGVLRHNGTLETQVEITPSEQAPSDFTQVQITATVDLASLGTDDGMLTQHLMSADYFEVETHPKATFQSTTINQNEDHTYKVEGDLTLKGETQSITLEKVKLEDKTATVDHELNLKAFAVVAEDEKKVSATAPLNIVVTFK